MNLKYHSMFSSVTDSRGEDYQETAKALNQNIYARLMASVTRILSRSPSKKEANTELEQRIGENVLRLVKRSGKLSVFLNGSLACMLSEKEAKAIRIVQEVLTAEIEGRVVVKRPGSRKLSTDRIELSPKNLKRKGLKFPESLYKAMEKDTSGESIAAAKRTFKSKDVLSERDYTYGVSQGDIDPADYEQAADFFLKKKQPLLRISTAEGHPLGDWYSFCARNDKTDEMVELLENGKKFYFTYEDKLYKYDPCLEQVMQLNK